MNKISQIIQETTEKIMKDLCTKEVVEAAEQGIFPTELWQTLVETGMTTIGIPEESGGTGGSLADALTFLRIAAQFSASIPIAETFVANWLLSKIGLPLLDKTTTIASFQYGNLITFNEASGGWTISGSAHDVPFARYAEAILVIGQSEQGNMVAIVDPDTCSIEEGKNYAGEARDHLYFKDVPVESDNVSSLSEVNANEFYYLTALIRGVQMSGALERILELSVKYSKERIQFGRPISKFQAIQQHIAILAGEVSAAKAMTELAMKSFEAGSGKNQIISAKIRVGEAASIATPIAHQVHGAIGFTEEHALQQSTRRLWSWRDEYGNESHWAKILGEEVLTMEADDLWPFITSMNSKISS
ncbi:acyl-CoA dehydrogenase family protein [Neobacillus sp. NPDC097160]|uniref:acyl-CoA dehydrogenase family protein n=1 Tax=Neobacillus sp. NPDC097160 TaxID=3364298 RepID=UPI0037F629F0